MSVSVITLNENGQTPFSMQGLSDYIKTQDASMCYLKQMCSKYKDRNKR